MKNRDKRMMSFFYIRNAIILFFFLFSSHLITGFVPFSFPMRSVPQKLKRIPASILHLFDRSAPKFLV